MASVDPYSTCPCGSGQKYKWCCQKVEAYAERAQRLIDSGQYEAALKPLEEGLAKVPDNPWLLTRKALSYAPSQPDGCRQAGLARFAPGTSRPPERIDPADAARAGNRRPGRGGRSVPASALGLPARTARAASRRWLHLSARHWPRRAFPPRRSSTWSSPFGWEPEVTSRQSSALHSLRANPAVSVWEKNPYRLSLPPANVSETVPRVLPARH